MKNTVFLALMVLAVLPASAQKAASTNCSVNSETSTALAEEYAANVDGLLRDAYSSLQEISEAVEAGSVSPERAQKLKLAVTRNTLARLDAISAVYDARLNSPLKANGTISVRELKREAAEALATTSTKQVTR